MTVCGEEMGQETGKGAGERKGIRAGSASGPGVVARDWEAEAGGLQGQSQPHQFKEVLCTLARSCLKDL